MLDLCVIALLLTCFELAALWLRHLFETTEPPAAADADDENGLPLGPAPDTNQD